MQDEKRADQLREAISELMDIECMTFRTLGKLQALYNDIKEENEDSRAYRAHEE